MDIFKSHTVMVRSHLEHKKSLLVVVVSGWQNKFSVSLGPGLLSRSRSGPDLDWTWNGHGPDLGPGLGPGPELDNIFNNQTSVSSAQIAYDHPLNPALHNFLGPTLELSTAAGVLFVK